MVRAAVRQSCLRCFGTGEIAQNYPPMSQKADWQVVPCPECGGRKVIAALEEMRKDVAVPVAPPTRCGNCGHVNPCVDERDEAIELCAEAIHTRTLAQAAS